MIRRLFGWWRVSESIAGQLTEPRRDALASDAAVLEMIQSSRLFSIVQALNLTVASAWRSSRVREVSRSAERMWLACPRTDRLRLLGRCTWSAAVTVLVLQTVESPQGAPFRWMLPLALGIGGILAELAAAPFVRTWMRRRG
jgi:hypothetical protein